ncbi:diguanylate cyclase [Acidaminobacter sp. JC074]|uniref:GGDEF domain-containing response regulator n=1 Tax=Acidaminobacter sp. JC074 TaxID=2530199 RepID=UPI001F0F56D4|nr:diguanylate cyclase [Acidaminobacter sp. JC074]MCH4887883.1 diguanylate cyclase [Acidaminobacter sp. JC074]
MKDIITNVLIVDDIEANRISFKAVINAPNIRLFEAKNGGECLKILMRESIDLVLLDIQMPDITGFEVAELMRENDRTKDIPIIFITAINKEEEYVFKGYELGAVDYLYKPIKKEILKSKVNVFVKLHVQAKVIEKKSEELEKKILDLEEAEKELLKLTQMDQLTGIKNRRAFDETLNKEGRRAIRRKTSLTLLMIDIDYFKNYNDTYGHVEGDECLKRVAACISKTLNRPFDLAARYGGEEFAVLLPDIELDGGVEVAERIRQNIEDLQIENFREGKPEVITVSIGIASVLPIIDEEVDQLVEYADEALYRAKEEGRNRCSW